MDVYVWIGAAGTLSLAALILLFRKVLFPGTATGIDAGWLAEFSVDTYRPMTRLLREEDYSFLESQPGYSPDLARDLRKKRRKILSAYLRNLGRDFERLHRAARILALYAPADNSNLVWALMAQSFAFWTAMIEIRLRLLIPAVPVNVGELLRRTDWLRGQVGGYLPEASAP